MAFLIVLLALSFLMFIAYRGYSVILFAPIAALGAVLLTDPTMVAPMFTGLFMDKMVGFVKNFFPVFLLGAVFGKVIELSGFSKAIVASVIKLIGRERAIPAIVLVCAVLTYGGVSLFVVVFAVYPFAAEMFSVKDLVVETIVDLSGEGHADVASEDQALAGVMKPNLVRALIQRGALR